MSRLRMTGLVRAARRAREQVRAGVPLPERLPFLDGVQGVVRDVEQILAEHGCDESDLSQASRLALAELRAIGGRSPASLTGAPDTVRGPVVRPSNVVRVLDVCLEALAERPADKASAEAMRVYANDTADTVEQLCEAAGSTPAQVPAPSRRAYAMLRWLSEPSNMERYVAQVRLACDVLPAVLERPCGVRIAAVHRVRFAPGRTTVCTRGKGDLREWRFSIGCLAADAEDLLAIGESVLLRGTAEPDTRARKTRFVRSEEYAALTLELELIGNPAPFVPRGCVYDLGVLFERLDRRFFQGALSKPNLTWRETTSPRTFGLFSASLDLACVDRRLDDLSVPEFVAEVVLYHELLHKKHGVQLAGGRVYSHTPAFRADESLHPRLGESDTWLSKLAARSRGG
jgi:hypothetical protein